MFLVNLVIGETYCNLDCDYCMYSKHEINKFSDIEISNFKENIRNLHNFITNRLPEIEVISITGGEPTLFPEIINEIYQKFDDKIIRISTNGTLISKNLDIDNLDPNRIFFVISIDGINLEDNLFRFKNKEILDNILFNIDTLLKKGFNVEILSTINPRSVANYLNLIEFFENKYTKEIEEKRLWCLPFGVVNYLNRDEFNIKQKILDKFIFNLEKNLDKYKLLSYYKEYFLEFIKFNKMGNVDSCEMNKWALHIKYLNNTLWRHGKFLLYGCGSTGNKVLGQMDLKDIYEEDLIIERIKSKFLEKYFAESDNGCKFCFENWHMYGLILNNKLSTIPKIFSNLKRIK